MGWVGRGGIDCIVWGQGERTGRLAIERGLLRLVEVGAAATSTPPPPPPAREVGQEGRSNGQRPTPAPPHPTPPHPTPSPPHPQWPGPATANLAAPGSCRGSRGRSWGRRSCWCLQQRAGGGGGDGGNNICAAQTGLGPPHPTPPRPHHHHHPTSPRPHPTRPPRSAGPGVTDGAWPHVGAVMVPPGVAWAAGRPAAAAAMAAGAVLANSTTMRTTRKVAIILSTPLCLSARLTGVGKGVVVTRGGGRARCCHGGPALLLGGAPGVGVGSSSGGSSSSSRAALLAAGGPLAPAQALAPGLEASQLAGPGLGEGVHGNVSIRVREWGTSGGEGVRVAGAVRRAGVGCLPGPAAVAPHGAGEAGSSERSTTSGCGRGLPGGCVKSTTSSCPASPGSCWAATVLSAGKGASWLTPPAPVAATVPAPAGEEWGGGAGSRGSRGW